MESKVISVMVLTQKGINLFALCLKCRILNYRRERFSQLAVFHFTFNAGMVAIALKVGGYSKLMDSSSYLKESILLTREMLPLLRAKGDKQNIGNLVMLYLPAGLMGFVKKTSELNSQDSSKAFFILLSISCIA